MLVLGELLAVDRGISPKVWRPQLKSEWNSIFLLALDCVLKQHVLVTESIADFATEKRQVQKVIFCSEKILYDFINHFKC